MRPAHWAANAFIGLVARFEWAMQRGLEGVVVSNELLAKSKAFGGDRPSSISLFPRW